MTRPQNIRQFKEWAQKNQGTQLFLHYDQRKAVSKRVTLVLANGSSVLFLDQHGRTMKIPYPRKGHYRFTDDFFSLKTLVFKYRIPDEQSQADDHRSALTESRNEFDFQEQEENNALVNLQHPGEAEVAKSETDLNPSVMDENSITEWSKRLWRTARKHGYPMGGQALILPPFAPNLIRTAPCPHRNLILLKPEETSELYTSRLFFQEANNLPVRFNDLFNNGTESRKGGPPGFNFPLVDLVIGFPPYGDPTDRDKLNPDVRWTQATTWAEYYLYRGLTLLRPGGLLVYLVRADPFEGELLFLQTGLTEAKRMMAEIADFETAFRLPTMIWSGKAMNNDVLVLKRKTQRAP